MINWSDTKPGPGIIALARLKLGSPSGLAILIFFHIVVCCVSLIKVAEYQDYMFYDPARLYGAVSVVAAFPERHCFSYGLVSVAATSSVSIFTPWC